jgi:hypothetical protein
MRPCECGHEYREHRYTTGASVRQLVCLYDDGHKVCACTGYRPDVRKTRR